MERKTPQFLTTVCPHPGHIKNTLWPSVWVSGHIFSRSTSWGNGNRT